MQIIFNLYLPQNQNLDQLIIMKPAWGSVCGVAYGVPGYSNAGFKWDRSKADSYQSYLTKAQSQLARDVYLGFKYQCVEYARRFLVHYAKAAFTDVDIAQDIWSLKTVEDLTKPQGHFEFRGYRQGGKELPQVGDLIIYQKSNHQHYGHVAVVVNVNVAENYVDIAEQNYEEWGWENQNYSRRLVLKRTPDSVEITNIRSHHPGKSAFWWDKHETIIGWKRVIK